MKKSSIIKISSAVIVFAVISVGFILLHSRSESIPYFEFLKEPKPFVKTTQLYKSEFGSRQLRTYYDFETDYNDFYERASAELTKLKFEPDNLIIHTLSAGSTIVPPTSARQWRYRDTGGSINVLIYRNYKLSDEEKNLQKLLTGSKYADDCVTVQIDQSNNQNKLVAIFKKLLNKFHEPAE